MLSVTLLKPYHAFASNTYLLCSGSERAVVDPSVPYSDSYGSIKYILLTHAHFDHFLDIDSWVNATGAEVIVSEADRPALSDSYRNCYRVFMGRDGGYFGRARAVSDGDILPLGEDTLTVISAPGHTVGSLIYHSGDAAFVGDLVFAGGGYGRYDLPGGDIDALSDSIERLLSFDNSLVIFCGHGESTTLGEYRRFYRNII